MSEILSVRELVSSFALRWAVGWSLACAGLVGFLGLGGKTVEQWQSLGALASAGGAFFLFGWLLQRALKEFVLMRSGFSGILCPMSWAASVVAVLFLALDSSLVEEHGPIGMAALAGLVGYSGSSGSLLALTRRFVPTVVIAALSALLFVVAMYLVVVVGYLAAILWGRWLPPAFFGALGGAIGGALAGAISAPLYRWQLSRPTFFLPPQ